MPSDDALDRLATLARIAAAHDGWHLLETYLRLRAEGRRAEAMRTLETFLGEAENWTFGDRRSLVVWLAEKSSFRRQDPLLLPHPLMGRLVIPTLSEWLARRDGSARAHHLFALYAPSSEEGADRLGHLRRAVDLDPTDQAARMTFVEWIIQGVRYAQHELPSSGYLGSAEADIASLQDALEMAAGLDETPLRQTITAELTEQLSVARAWAAYLLSGRATSFAKWCAQRGAPATML